MLSTGDLQSLEESIGAAETNETILLSDQETSFGDVEEDANVVGASSGRMISGEEEDSEGPVEDFDENSPEVDNSKIMPFFCK